MSLPVVYDLTLYQNQDYSLPFGFGVASDDGQLSGTAAISFAGATFKGQVRESADPATPTLLDFSAGISSADGATFPTVPPLQLGAVTLDFTAAELASLPTGELYYEVLMTQGGLNTYLIVGKLIIRGTGTR